MKIYWKYTVSNVSLKFSYHCLCILKFFSLCSIIFVSLQPKTKTQYGMFGDSENLNNTREMPLCFAPLYTKRYVQKWWVGKVARTENCTGQQKPYAQGKGKSWCGDNIATDLRRLTSCIQTLQLPKFYQHDPSKFILTNSLIKCSTR